MEGREVTLLTDPFFKSKMLWLKRRVPPAMRPRDLPPIDAVLISHTHPDHFDPAAIKALQPRPVLVMPWGRGRRLRKQGFEVVDLRPGESWTCKNVKITAVKARHNAWHNLGYLIAMDGKTIYFTGDTKLFCELEDLAAKSIDIMLMPYGGTPVIGNIWTLPQAVRAVAAVKPKVCVPIHRDTFTHWLTGRASASPERFREHLEKETTGTRCVILNPGESF